jgi:uncharacterized protein
VIELDLHLPGSHSLKDKRAVVKPIVVGARQRFGVAASEVDHQDLLQRAAVAMAYLGPQAGHVGKVLDDLERWIWSQPGLEVVSCVRTWLDPES